MVGTKICFKCGKRKLVSLFYKHSAMWDGFLGKCKECTKKDVSLNYRANIDQYKKYDTERNKRPERRKAATSRCREYRTENPEKVIAHSLVSRAVKSGKIVKKPCVVCGATSNLEAHHANYEKPLDVTWLCSLHHRHEHGHGKQF